jgi:hypothetical protein
MDTTELTSVLHEATDGLEPRGGFAAAVLSGGRRRRVRGRIALGAAVAGTAAVAVAAAVVVPHQLAAPPPGDGPDGTGKVLNLLDFAGGDLVQNEEVVRLAITGWRDGLERTPANERGVLDDRVGEPHVYWAGTTPAGPAALVTQLVTLPSDGTLEPADRGQQVPAVGLLATNPDDLGDESAKPELELVGVQVQTLEQGSIGYFVLPDDRTVLAIEEKAGAADAPATYASPSITVGDDGVSRREWTRMSPGDGVALTRLPPGTVPQNVRIVAGAADSDPNEGEQKVGAHLPLQFAAEYVGLRANGITDRDLPWEPREWSILDGSRALPRPAKVLFEDALRTSGLLDSASYDEKVSGWLAAGGIDGDRLVLVGTKQELDNPAYLFTVVLRADFSVERVTRDGQVDPTADLPVAVRLPHGAGWVVGVDPDRELRYRTATDTQWSAPASGTVAIPDDAEAVLVNGREYPLG